MRANHLLLFAMLLLLLIACSRGNAPVQKGTQASSPDFSVEPIKGTTALPFALDVALDGEVTVVTVELSSEVTVNDLFFKVTYDASSFSPAGVEFERALGQSVDLSISSEPGEVAVGTSRVREAGEEGVSVSGKIASIKFKPMPFIDRRVSGLAPLNTENRILDLDATAPAGGVVTIKWTEMNLGDYDSSGEVGVPDITPIATNYLVSTGTILSLVDGDNSGEIGISDISVIAQNYLNSIAGYRLNVMNNGSWTMIPNPNDGTSPYTINRSDGNITGLDRATFEFNYTLQTGDEENFQTQPVGPDASLGIVSNSTGGGIDIPPPAKITDLDVSGSEALGTDAVELTWTPPNDPYLDHYEVWWQEGGDGSALSSMDNAVDGAVDSLLVDGCTPGTEYWFVIRAVNYDAANQPQRAPFSNLASGHVWNGPEPSPPVTDLTAEGSEAIGEGIIRLNWTPPNDPYLENQQILMQTGGDGSNLTVYKSDLAVDATTYDVTVATDATCWFMVRGINKDIYNQTQYGEDGNIASAEAYFETPPIPELTDVTAIRERTTYLPSEDIPLTVTTNLDGGAYEDVQTFEWTVLSGGATISSGANARDCVANVTGPTTATFQVTVDNTIQQKTATIMVIGTAMAPFKAPWENSNIFELGGNFNFTAESYVMGPNYSFGNWVDDQNVTLLNFWSHW